MGFRVLFPSISTFFLDPTAAPVSPVVGVPTNFPRFGYGMCVEERFPDTWTLESLPGRTLPLSDFHREVDSH